MRLDRQVGDAWESLRAMPPDSTDCPAGPHLIERMDLVWLHLHNHDDKASSGAIPTPNTGVFNASPADVTDHTKAGRPLAQ